MTRSRACLSKIFKQLLQYNLLTFSHCVTGHRTHLHRSSLQFGSKESSGPHGDLNMLFSLGHSYGPQIQLACSGYFTSNWTLHHQQKITPPKTLLTCQVHLQPHPLVSWKKIENFLCNEQGCWQNVQILPNTFSKQWQGVPAVVHIHTRHTPLPCSEFGWNLKITKSAGKSHPAFGWQNKELAEFGQILKARKAWQ